jgi:class 3 adenylate cyclase
LHSGEVEIQDGQIGGIAVHIAARVMALAHEGKVLVSGTVTRLLSAFAIAGLKVLLARGFGWRVVH